MDETDPAERGERIPQKSVHDLAPGSVVSVHTPGAGGFGDPSERSREAVRHDYRLGKITAEYAREHHDIDPDTVENEPGTERGDDGE